MRRMLFGPGPGRRARAGPGARRVGVGPGPYGYIVGYVATDWGIAYVNGQTVTLRGGWFCIPARPGAQAVNVSVPGAGTVMRWVDVPAGGVAVVPFGQM